MDDDGYNTDSLFSDLAPEQRFGFFDMPPLDLSPEFEEVVKMLEEISASVEAFTDQYGYEWQIISSVVDEKNRRLAWVEWKFKDSGRIEEHNYYLKARDSAGALFYWEIETYNPYFGCSVKFLDWIKDAAVIIYREKHDVFVAALKRDAAVKRVKISDEWKLNENILIYRDKTRNKSVGLKLPCLEETEIS